MIALLFVVLLLFAIWLAVRLGGVRRRDRHSGTGTTGGGPESAPTTGFEGGGGDFGGGGGSGSWGDAGDGDGGGD